MFALSLFLLLLLAVALCAAVVVWICPLCSTICRAYLLSQVCLAQSVERKALSSRVRHNAFSANLAAAVLAAQRKVFLFSLSLSPFQAVHMLSLSSFLAHGHGSLCVAVVVLISCFVHPSAEHSLYAEPALLSR